MLHDFPVMNTLGNDPSTPEAVPGDAAPHDLPAATQQERGASANTPTDALATQSGAQPSALGGAGAGRRSESILAAPWAVTVAAAVIAGIASSSAWLWAAAAGGALASLPLRRRLLGRQPQFVAVLAVTLAAAASAATEAGVASALATSRTVTGTVAGIAQLPGGGAFALNVDGVWVTAADGGSGWANWAGGSIARFFYRLPNGGPYMVHVGCGGNPSHWAVEIRFTRWVRGDHSFRCYPFTPQRGDPCQVLDLSTT